MSSATVLYVEDSEPQRLALHKALKQRGFRVEVAGDVKTARAQIDSLGENLDVLVLDMRLEDPEFPHLTGADVALEHFNPHTPWPPEFLIQSAFSEVDYYRLALKLGAAAYLPKAEFKQEQAIRHIRALAIRRDLSVKRPEIGKRIHEIVERSQRPLEAVGLFCQEVLIESLRYRLGAPFILLLTYAGKTLCFPVESELPAQSGVYETLQAMAFAEVRHLKPFILTEAEKIKIAPQCNPEEKAILTRLRDAAFLPLSVNPDVSLSLVVLRETSDKNPLAEKPDEIANVLMQYFERAVLELFLFFLTRLTEHATRAEELRRATALICLNAGQELQSILREADTLERPLSENAACNQLADDLLSTGSMLNALSRDEERGAEPPPAVPLAMAQFVRGVWEDFDGGIDKTVLTIAPESDCQVRAAEDDLLIVVSRLLQWFSKRLDHTPAGMQPSIHVTCAEVEGAPQVVFEDRSARLEADALARLFEPFADTVTNAATTQKLADKPGLYLPLYLAKVLVEVKYKGRLADCSDEVSLMDEEGEPVGHRFVMKFRAARA
jgi:DNA-binding NarL/FixJ family response regulator